MIAKMSQSAEAALLRGRHHIWPKILQDFSHLWKTREVSSHNFETSVKGAHCRGKFIWSKSPGQRGWLGWVSPRQDRRAPKVQGWWISAEKSLSGESFWAYPSHVFLLSVFLVVFAKRCQHPHNNVVVHLEMIIISHIQIYLIGFTQICSLLLPIRRRHCPSWKGNVNANSC